MTEPLPDVWISRDYPVLREITRRFDLGADWVEDHEIATSLSLEIQVARQACKALARRGLIQKADTLEGDVTVCELNGQAYLITGLHPDGGDVVEQLVSLLRQASEQAGEEDERTRLRRAASALSDASGKILTGVATAWVTGVLPH